MINDLPTVFEVVTGKVNPSKDQPATKKNGNKSKSSGKTVRTTTLHIHFNVFYFVLLTIRLSKMRHNIEISVNRQDLSTLVTNGLTH